MTTKEQIKILSAHVSESRFAKMLRAVSYRTRKLTVVLEDIFQPHNAAAVLRNCDAFGLQEVHLIENKFRMPISSNVDMGVSKWQDIYKYTSPYAKVQRNGMPKDHNVYPEEVANTQNALKSLKDRGFILAASVLGAKASINDIPVDKPVALLVGTELKGLSKASQEMADVSFSMDMLGFAQSFNLSVFSALCLANLSERMRADNSWKLLPEEQDKLLLQWLKVSVSDWQKYI
ncbi:MAG: RNA methyltransferase [Verrucomicrobiaceae bacterium]|nr:RNA methyltransferase [Verrucomicrobiaceae bacterium]